MGINRRQWFSDESLEAAKKKMDGLPDTPPRRNAQQTAAEVIAELRSRIRKRRRQGYTYEQIADELKEAGVPIPASTIKYHSRPKIPSRRRASVGGARAETKRTPVLSRDVVITVEGSGSHGSGKNA